MSPEQQRIAIVGACPSVFVRPVGQCGWNYKSSVAGRVLPCIDGDPLKDLNAMHEAFLTLSEDDRSEFCEILMDICDGAKNAVNATAAQRAEAFLRTLHLWKD